MRACVIGILNGIVTCLKRFKKYDDISYKYEVNSPTDLLRFRVGIDSLRPIVAQDIHNLICYIFFFLY